MKKLVILGLCIGVACVLFAGTAQAATEAEKQAAIDSGLAWLASQQQADGRWRYNPWDDNNVDPAVTGSALLAFIEEGHTPTSGTAYSTHVQNGLNYLFSRAGTIAISAQPAGDPDSNGNRVGVNFVGGAANNTRSIYSTGLALPAIAALGMAHAGDTVTVGPLTGWTYQQVVQDTIDYLAYAQIETSTWYPNARGGWRYYENYPWGADNSTSQWPVIAALYATQMGVNMPAWVEDEHRIWVNYIQNADGGSDYPDTKGWGSNEARTGAWLVQADWIGTDPTLVTNADVAAALAYLNTNWSDTEWGTWNGNFGHPYAMWGIYKGLELTIGLDDMTTITPRPQGSAVIDNPDHGWNWWEDYCEFLIHDPTQGQNAAGYWPGYTNWTGPLAAAWHINILAATEIPGTDDIIPEPGTVVLLGLGLAGMALVARRRRKS